MFPSSVIINYIYIYIYERNQKLKILFIEWRNVFSWWNNKYFIKFIKPSYDIILLWTRENYNFFFQSSLSKLTVCLVNVTYSDMKVEMFFFPFSNLVMFIPTVCFTGDVMLAYARPVIFLYFVLKWTDWEY